MCDTPRIQGLQAVLGCEPNSSEPAPPVGRAPSMPDPRLDAMVGGEDIGAAVAALVMLSSKESRKSARAAADASNEAMESAQRAQLAHMREAASSRLMSGLASGGYMMAGAAAGASQGGESAGKACEAMGKISSTVMTFGAENEDAAAKSSGNAADHAKRTADASNDDVKDANDSLKKATEFLKEWTSSKSAAQAAALHRA